MKRSKKIVFSDLDGTLLNSDFKISAQNLESMHKLKKNGYLIALATGRNLYSTQKVLSDDLPVDYLIFSTGVAIQNFRTKEIFHSNKISIQQSRIAVNLLKNLQQNFFVHFPVPDNHKFYFNKVNNDGDFSERFKLYEQFANPLPKQIDIEISQIVVVLPYDIKLYEKIFYSLKNVLPNLSYIRATSPINHKHIWLEIYPPNVSKGCAIKTLCDYLAIDLQNTYAIGNDYNDIDMLQVVGNAYVVKNAPEEMRKKYNIVKSNDYNGFSQMVERILG